jgi:hypothetical protein
MYRNKKLLLSIPEIERIYPNEWVALAVSETDAHGFARTGEVMLHSSDEQFVWRTVGREEVEEPVYVFFSSSNREAVAA